MTWQNLFDSFGDAQEEASGALAARYAVEQELGEMPTMLDASVLLKSEAEGLIEPHAIYYFQRSRAWLVQVDATTDAGAEKLGRKVQRLLTSKRSLTASDPFMHALPLFVAFDGGYIKLTAKK